MVKGGHVKRTDAGNPYLCKVSSERHRLGFTYG